MFRLSLYLHLDQTRRLDKILRSIFSSHRLHERSQYRNSAITEMRPPPRSEISAIEHLFPSPFHPVPDRDSRPGRAGGGQKESSGIARSIIILDLLFNSGH